MKGLWFSIIIACMLLIASTALAQSTPILIGGEDTELSQDGIITGSGSSERGGLGAALLDTFTVNYQPLGEGDFMDNVFPDPERYSLQMNIPEGLPDYQCRGVTGNWDSRGRNGEGRLPWVNENHRWYEQQYRPTGDEPLFGVVYDDSAQWTIDYWGVDRENRFIHTCLTGTVEDFTYNDETGDATALLILLESAYLGYGDDNEPGPGLVEYETGVYQGFDLHKEASGPLSHPAYFFEYDGEENSGILTPCGTKIVLKGEGGWIKGYFDVIQDGIDAAEDGDTVLVSPGTYVENINFMGKNIVVGSLFLTTGDEDYIEETIIDGDEDGSVVTFENEESEDTVLTGFTIQNGYAAYGGGVYIRQAGPTLDHLVIRNNNSYPWGGGILCSYAEQAVLSHLIVQDNRSGSGGGIFVDSSSVVSITDSHITGNHAIQYFGGGVCCFPYQTTVRMRRVVISENQAAWCGGGIACHQEGPTSIDFEDGEICGNSADIMGAAAYFGDSEVTLSYVLISNNRSRHNVGGIYLRETVLNLNNVTMSQNEAEIPLEILCSIESELTLTNTILRGDSIQISSHPDYDPNIITILYSNIEGGRDEIGIIDGDELNWGEGNIDEDPLFVDPDEGDYHLIEDSPCIDAGDPDSPEDPDNTRADMGAFYFHQIGQYIDVPIDFETIQEAIDAAEDGDTILVHPGTYIENIDFIGKDIVVGSLFLTTDDEAYIDSTVIDGDSSGTVVTFENGESENAQLIGFTITNGMTDENGGGILCIDSSPTVRSCRIVGNSAEVSGGGLYVYGECTPVFYRCEFIGNVSWQTGGGISIAWQAASIFKNCLMVSNVTQEDGHTAACSDGSSVTFTNCTIAQNGVPWEHPHGSIFCAGAEVILVNTISFENFIAEVRFDPWGEASRAIISHSNIDGVSTNDNGEVYWEEGNIDEDPLFIDREEGDYNLSEGSPCIDAGTAFFVWEEDTLVNLTPDDYIGNAPDMGAFESEFVSIKHEMAILPGEFVLYQNCPNPFNSSTLFRFDLPFNGRVVLTVFDVTGRKVSGLVDDDFEAGRHSMLWDAQNIPSGIYIARLEAQGEFRMVKLMLVR